MSSHLGVLLAVHHDPHHQIGRTTSDCCHVVLDLDVLLEGQVYDYMHALILVPNTISSQLVGVRHVYFPLHSLQQIGLANGLHEVNVGHSGGIGSDELCQDEAD